MLFERMKIERIEAMKSSSHIKKNLLSTLIGDATKLDKTPSDEKVIATVKSFLKNIQKSIDECAEKGITLSIESEFQYATELAILEDYLPKQLTETEIRKEVSTLLNAHYRTIGEIMNYFKTRYAGTYDGALVSKIAKELI
jgi:uncharacterized protein YqeY